MTIELKDGDHVLAFAFVGADDKDWLGAVWTSGDRTHLRYRFRYYSDDKLFGSEDEKEWYGFSIEASRAEEMAGTLAAVARLTEGQWDASICEVIRVDGDGARMAELMAERPWAMSMKRDQYRDPAAQRVANQAWEAANTPPKGDA